MAEQAKAVVAVAKLEVSDLVERLPAETAAHKLARVSLLGLDRLEQIVSMELDPLDLKQMRLIGDMALGANKLLMRAAEQEFRIQRDSAIAKLIESLVDMPCEEPEE